MKSPFIVPKNIKVHDVEMELNDLHLDAAGPGAWEARAEYRAVYSVVNGDKSLTLRFDSADQFNNLLATANGKVVEK